MAKFDPRRGSLTALLLCVMIPTGIGTAQPQVLDVYRPRIALAADGSFAVAWEALIQNITQSWQIAVQRYGADGVERGPVHLFAGESCSGLDIWTSDFMEGAELAFQSDGTLLVVMTHTGDFSFGGDGIFTSEATLGAVAADGRRLDLHDAGACTQHKLIFPGGNKQTLPRMAVGPDDSVYITLQGGFDHPEAGEEWFLNVALRILDGQGNTVVEQYIPHDDPISRHTFHGSPDIAVSASTLLVVWHECVVLDLEGNTNDCDIGAQFFDGQRQPIGGNVKVNDVGIGQADTYSLSPSVAMNPAGRSVVVWADNRTGGGGDLFAQVFSADGQKLGSNVQVSAGEGTLAHRPEVVMLEDGRFTVAWDVQDAGGTGRAYGRSFSAEGAPLGSAALLESDPALETGLPALATDGSRVLAAWAARSEEGKPLAVYTSNRGRIVNNERFRPRTSELALQGYPNPVVDRAVVTYHVDGTAPVTLSVYDMLGREVARLVEGVQQPGRYTEVVDAAAWPSGVYVVRLRQGGAVQTTLLVRR